MNDMDAGGIIIGLITAFLLIIFLAVVFSAIHDRRLKRRQVTLEILRFAHYDLPNGYNGRIVTIDGVDIPEGDGPDDTCFDRYYANIYLDALYLAEHPSKYKTSGE